MTVLIISFTFNEMVNRFKEKAFSKSLLCIFKVIMNTGWLLIQVIKNILMIYFCLIKLYVVKELKSIDILAKC